MRSKHDVDILSFFLSPTMGYKDMGREEEEEAKQFQTKHFLVHFRPAYHADCVYIGKCGCRYTTSSHDCIYSIDVATLFLQR